MITMPFGVHAARPLSEVPDDYLRWLLKIDLRERLRDGVEAELGRRKEEHLQRLDRLPNVARVLDSSRGEGRTVCGVKLDGIEAARFDQAVLAAELIITPDLPLASELPKAWRLWCEENGRPHREREVKMAELMTEWEHTP